VTTILVAGPNDALLEGVVQTLVGAGHRVVSGPTIPEAIDSLGELKPLVGLVDCDELMARPGQLQPLLAHGGALLAFQCDDDDAHFLPFSVKRTTLAQLRLPLERQRLLALVKFVESRAHAAGRDSDADSRFGELRLD
jgi:hypothetical protein